MDRKKNEIISKLVTIEGLTDDKTWKAWLRQAIEFIEEQK